MYPYEYTRKTQRLTLPSDHILTDLEDTNRWLNIKESFIAIIQMLLLGIVALVVVYGFIRAILLDMVTTGVSVLPQIAVVILLVLFGYWIRGKRDA